MANSPETLLKSWLLSRAEEKSAWLEAQLRQLEAGGPERDLHIFLGQAPRVLGKAMLDLSPAEMEEAETARPGWTPSDWSIDGAARVLGLLVYRGTRSFAETFKDLRRTSDAAEMIALYRGLPLYPDPDSLHFEVGEGLRSNLRPVFEAIAHRNPFPRDHFDDHRWNHMVLKALFVGSSLTPITGLEARANPELARILIDYARERRAAGRPVTDDLWIPVRAVRDDPAVREELDRALTDGILTTKEVA